MKEPLIQSNILMDNRPSKQQIEEWKAKHGKIYMITLDPKKEGAAKMYFVFKRMDRSVLAASAQYAEKDPIKAAYVQVTNTMIFGDNKALDETDVFLGVLKQFNKINDAIQSGMEEF